MRLLDPFQGYKIASGNIYMRLTYFCQILYIFLFQLHWDFFACESALFVMFIVHAICFVLEALRSLLHEFKSDLVLLPNILDIVIIVLYQGAIFYVQVVLITLEDKKAN